VQDPEKLHVESVGEKLGSHALGRVIESRFLKGERNPFEKDKYVKLPSERRKSIGFPDNDRRVFTRGRHE